MEKIVCRKLFSVSAAVLITVIFSGCGLGEMILANIPTPVSNARPDKAIKDLFAANKKVTVVISDGEYERKGIKTNTLYLAKGFKRLARIASEVYREELKDHTVTYLDYYLEKTGIGISPSTFDYSAAEGDILVFLSINGNFMTARGNGDYMKTTVYQEIFDKKTKKVIGKDKVIILANKIWRGNAHFSIMKMRNEDTWTINPPDSHERNIESQMRANVKLYIDKIIK